MPYMTEVVVVLATDPPQPLANVEVALFDQDRFTKDDALGRATTGAAGRAAFSFDASAFRDLDDPLRTSLPDLYAVVYGADGQVAASTRSTPSRDSVPSEVRVSVDMAAARKHRLLPRKPRRADSERRQDWVDRLKARSRKPGGEVDLCIARVVLDMIAGAANPTNDLQKKLASAVPKKDLVAVGGFAREALARFDAAGLSVAPTCSSGSDPRQLWEKLSGPGAPLAALARGLAMPPTPDPSTDPGPPTAGLPFKRLVPLDKDCADEYKRNHGGQAPTPNAKLEPPQIHRVRIFHILLHHQVERDLVVADKRLSVRRFDGTGTDHWGSREIDLDVALTSEECLVARADASGRQIAVVDVTAGQCVELAGSGFIAAKAQLVVRRYLWDSSTSDGRLHPEEFEYPIAGWGAGMAVDVQGAAIHPAGATPATFSNDLIQFNWPATLGEAGLYEFRLSFENETGIPTRVLQRTGPPGDCEFDEDHGPIESGPIWFAVLPKLDDRKVSPRITEVRCLDESDPERFGPINYFDDIFVQTQAKVTSFSVPGLNSGSETFADDASSGHEQWFWSDGTLWNVDIPLLRPTNDPILLSFDRSIIHTIFVHEIFGETDKALLKAVLAIALVALLILLTALVLIITLDVLAVLIAITIATEGLASPITVVAARATFEVCSAIVTAIWTVLLPSGLLAIHGFVDGLEIAPDEMLSVAPMFVGNEVAHSLSPYRFHRRLWGRSRPTTIGRASVESSIDMSDPARPRFVEKYKQSAGGGQYEVKFELISPLN
jgi:hypothetical protein